MKTDSELVEEVEIIIERWNEGKKDAHAGMSEIFDVLDRREG